MISSKRTNQRPRLSFFVSHLTPFEGPLYPKIVRQGQLELDVYFWRKQPLEQWVERGGIKLQWDSSSALQGYSYHELPSQPLTCWRYILNQALTPPEHRVALINGWSTKASILALIAARLRNIPIILRLDTVDLYPTSLLKTLRRRIVRSIIYRLPAAFMGISSLTRQHLQRWGIKNEAIFTFPYAIDNAWLAETAARHSVRRTDLRHALGIESHTDVIMTALKFFPREGARDIVQAFAGLEAWHNATTLLLVGDGPMRPDLEDLVQQHPTMKVVFTGWVPYARLIELFAISDLFVHPGLEEPWGCSVQEAAACRLPIIGSDLVGATHDLVQPGVNGMVYQGGNVEALRAALIAMLKQREQWSAMGEQSWRIVQDWGHERCILELEQAVDYALSNAR